MGDGTARVVAALALRISGGDGSRILQYFGLVAQLKSIPFATGRSRSRIRRVHQFGDVAQLKSAMMAS